MRFAQPFQWFRVTPPSPPQDCHGFHFNRCETSEEQDKEEARVQRMYVGVASETASTCNSLHSKGSKSNFVSKARQQPQQQPPSAPGSVKSVGASSKRNLGECSQVIVDKLQPFSPRGLYSYRDVQQDSSQFEFGLKFCPQAARNQSRRPRERRPRGARATRTRMTSSRES